MHEEIVFLRFTFATMTIFMMEFFYELFGRRKSVKCYLSFENSMARFYGWGSTASRLEPLRVGSLLLPLSSHKFLVLILLTSEG